MDQVVTIQPELNYYHAILITNAEFAVGFIFWTALDFILNDYLPKIN